MEVGRLHCVCWNWDIHLLLTSDIEALGSQASRAYWESTIGSPVPQDSALGLELHCGISWAFRLWMAARGTSRLHNRVSQFLIINLFVYIYISTIGSVSLEELG